jgi:hypothetical protein
VAAVVGVGGAGIGAVRDGVAVVVDRFLRVPGAWILAIGDAVAVGVLPAGVDAGVGRVVGTRVPAVGRLVAVAVGVRGVARAGVLAVADAVAVGVGRAGIAAEPTRQGGK